MQHNNTRWTVHVKIAALSFYATPSAILHVEKLIANANAKSVELDHEPTADEVQQIARERLQRLQQEVDEHLRKLNPEYSAPLDIFGVNVEPLP
jgi:hypothetical protein